MADYVWARGSHVRLDANEVGRELETIARAGTVTAVAVLDAARPPEAPLHAAFEWDDAVAGELYRLDQARYVVRSIRILDNEGGEPERVFFHVKTESLDSYVTKAVLVADDDLRRAALNEALRMLVAARQRYRELDELSAVWTAIDQLEIAAG